MEFVRVIYPKPRRVLLDGDDFAPTNRTFEVERGTHSFAIDEPTEPAEIIEFIELTAQQAPRELTFTPVFGVAAVGTRGVAPKAQPVAKPRARKQRAAKAKAPAKAKAAAKKKPAAKTKAKRAAKPKRPSKRTAKKPGRR